MSELADSNGASRDRLDSWKAIAKHLGRDERTVRRWEKKGLPVRRVPGGRGHSVFAYVSELDAWLRAAASETNQPPDSIHIEEPIAAILRLPRWALASGAAVVVLASLLLVSGTRGDELLSVQLTPQGVIAAGADGKERWRYVPPDDERPFWLQPPHVFRSAPAGVLAATSMRVASMPSLEQGGQLMWFTPQGALARTWELDDRVIYTAERYNPPWVITDVQPMERDNGRLLAVTAHHYTWWPGLLTVLDRDWRRLGTFVNAGWIDQVRWLGSDRLIAAGFSNEYDGGFIALLDLARLSGQSPSNDDGPFKCVSCGDVSPIRYLVFPRSDVNRAGSGTFNRAAVQLLDGKLLVHTIETMTEDQNLAGMTVYELAPDLTPRSAAHSDRYWQEHRALEARGTLRHDRAQCPDRDGPKSIEMWEPQSGWRTIALR